MQLAILRVYNFCLWHAATYISKLCYDVTIINNLFRGKINSELKAQSSTLINQRCKVFKDHSVKEVNFAAVNLANKIINFKATTYLCVVIKQT